MLTKARIVSLYGNKATIEVPLFKSAGKSYPVEIEDVIICSEPGSLNGYAVDDIVIIGFQNNNLGKPIILGKLFLGAKKAKEDGATNFSYNNSLTVTNSTTLSEHTTIGDIEYSELQDAVTATPILKEKLSQINNSFTEVEHPCGDWLNGEKIYRKTYKVSVSIERGKSFEGDLPLPVDISKIDNIWVDVSHTFVSGALFSSNVYYERTNDYFNCYINKGSGYIRYKGAAKEPITDIYITIEYTLKTIK